jgi:hydroxymethylbilane synthase
VGCVIGTASTRRKAQLVSSAPGVKVVNLRGSVQARLAALREGKVDATLLALSGG